jgi:small subunit ribosomal protein S17
MSETKTKTRKRGNRRRILGKVKSDKGDKTIKVVVNFVTKHALYGKYIRHRTSVHAHDPANEAREGDTVEVMECRPISKMKNWQLVRVITKANEAGA